MEKVKYQFEDFLAEVNQEYKNFAVKIHESLIQDGYRVKVESKSAGFFVSYSHPKTKRSMLNFLFRRKGLLVRIYADNYGQYADFLNSLPEKMEKEISKASVCKRLINPEDCNPKCVKGYDFNINDKHYLRCRYSCFQFLVDDESLPAIEAFVKKERVLRNEA